MSDPAQPLASRALRRVWRQPLPEEAHWTAHSILGPLALTPAGERVAIFSGGVNGVSGGSLTVFDSRTGDVVHQITDDWVVYSMAFSPDSQSLATAEHRSDSDESRLRIV